MKYGGQKPSKVKRMEQKEWKTKITAILEKMHREDWMDDDDFFIFVETMVCQLGGWDTLFRHIEEGTLNGYAPEQQFEIAGRIFT